MLGNNFSTLGKNSKFWGKKEGNFYGSNNKKKMKSKKIYIYYNKNKMKTKDIKKNVKGRIYGDFAF